MHMPFTILASYAQEESKSASDNQKWRIQKGFEAGELMCLSVMYGYSVSNVNGIEIDEEQAKIVREIYARVIHGVSLNSIARWLNRNQYYGAYGGRWNASRVRDLVRNEKYTGNALLQKSYVNNHIEKKLVPNHGEMPRYYATDTHPAIIDQQTHDAAQKALDMIAASCPSRRVNQHYAFTGIILCPSCGRHYKRVLNHGLTRWVCPTFMQDGKEFCQSKKIPEEILMRVCCKLFDWNSFNEQALRDAVDHITAV